MFSKKGFMMNMYPILLFVSCSVLFATATIAQTPSILICRAKQCVEARQTVSREYLFNQVSQLLDKNIGKDISLCEADPTTRVCLTSGISFPAHSQTIQTSISISAIKLIDAKILPNVTGIDLILDYKIKAGDTFPRCQTALSRLGVMSSDNIQTMSPQFNCHLTETGNTVLSIVYNIDYIDFDYGMVGAHFSAASGQSILGGKTGYALMRFTHSAPITDDDIFKMETNREITTEQKVVNNRGARTQMDAIWMKPTPFLELETPVFMPEECTQNMGVCSAQTLNAISNIPTASNTQPSKLPYTPGVASTTGLIQQTKTVLPPPQGMTKTITTHTQVISDGKPVYAEEEVRRFVQQTPDSPLIEDKEATIKTSSGTNPALSISTDTELPLTEQISTELNPDIPIFDSQHPLVNVSIETSDVLDVFPTQKNPSVSDSTPASPVTSSSNQASENHIPQTNSDNIVQNTTLPQQKQPNILMVPQMPTPAVLPQGQITSAPNVEIITPEGVTLTPDEQSYIQQMPLPQEIFTAPGVADVSFYISNEQSPATTANMDESVEQPIKQSQTEQSTVFVPTKTSDPKSQMTNTNQSEPTFEEKVHSFFGKAEKYLYF